MSSSTRVETLWFTKGDKQPVDLLSDTDYADRVESRCGENSCTWFTCKGMCALRIRDLRQTDSAEYKFRFTTNRPGVRGDRCNRVSYPTRNMCVLRGTSVDISCTYSSYEALPHKYWFKWRGNQQSRDLRTEYGGRVKYPAEKTGRSTLRITDLRETDSAEYRFTFKSTSHEWKGLSVEVTPVATVTEGQRVTLTCMTSCPLTDKPSYMWYQNNGPVTGPESPENQLVLDPVSPRHAGNYACSVRNYPHLRSPEETLTVQCTMCILHHT
ncbi:Sialoadhesin [Merluccius polli]|uniref:B-cell receptor CD22 n=1 Tax=Merluccius polli TaxID=89951 RepID=A0AA47NT98_MERPO|nr:Sialoadhesin [Merluccius polli]